MSQKSKFNAMSDDDLLAAAIAASIEEENKKKKAQQPPKPSKKDSDDEEEMKSDDDDDMVQDDDDEYYDDDGDNLNASQEVEMDTDDIDDVEYNSDNEDIQIDEDKGVEARAYECLSREDIVDKQTQAITKVSDFLSVPFSTARILLQQCKWESESLFTEWTDNREKLCKKVGIEVPTGETEKPLMGKKGKGTCSICDEDSDQIYTLACNHGFCNTCWKEYLSLQIKEKKQKIVCPGYKCGKVIDEYCVQQLAGPENLKKYNETLVTSYVENNNSVKWCPAPNCKYAILLRDVTIDQPESIKCKCGYYFCFRCGEEGHAPAFCEWRKEWNVKNSGGDEALNEKALAVLSRKCPNDKCQNRIQKNGGCNHMHCTKCGYHFCWQCMGKFGSGPMGGSDGYGSHKCNNYIQEDDNLKLDKEDWERFRWYSERFNNHNRSKGIEARLLKESNAVRGEMQEATSLTWAATQFYVDAIDQMLMNRAVMMWSYVFGFFRPLKRPEINKNLFEHRQNELERHTEKLAKWFDNEMEPEDSIKHIAENRLNIINDTKLSQASYKALNDVAANALEPGANEMSRATRKQLANQSRNKLTRSRGGPDNAKPTPEGGGNERPDETNIIARQEQQRRRREQEKAELDRIMQQSKQEAESAEQRQLRLAIEASLKENKNAPKTTAPATEDDDLMEAIRLSLLDNKPKKK